MNTLIDALICVGAILGVLLVALLAAAGDNWRFTRDSEDRSNR